MYSLSLGSRCSRPSLSVTSYRIEHNVSVYKEIYLLMTMMIMRGYGDEGTESTTSIMRAPGPDSITT